MGGRHVSRRRISRAEQTKNWCVGFSFPPPAYAGIHPTLYLFGFRANALNSHSPAYLPGFNPGSGLRCFREFLGLFPDCSGFAGASPGASGGPPGASGGLRGRLGASGVGSHCGQHVGFGSGFRVFWPVHKPPAWRILDF